MKYNVRERILASDKEDWSKRIECPLNKRWHELQLIERHDGSLEGSSERDRKRHCPSCSKDVIDITEFDDRQVGALISVDPLVCIHASRSSHHITVVGEVVEYDEPDSVYSCSSNTVGVPVVHTARSVCGINTAAKQGYWPLIVEASPSDKIRQKIIVHQNDDGSILTSGDLRSIRGGDDNTYWHNPYKPALPFAAYLIPPGLEPGTRVYLTDVIEDVSECSWNQGDSYRSQSGFAIWDGKKMNMCEEDIAIMLG